MRRWVVLACVVSIGTAASAQARRPQPARAVARKAHARSPAPSYDSSAVNDPSTAAPLEEKSVGSAALRAQILLDRANFSVGEIDGRIGANAIRALTQFRIARDIPAGSGVDGAVWMALNADNAPALITYTITADDLKGPFVQIPSDMMAKAKLESLGYASPLDELAERFHISPALLQKLNKGSKCETEGEQIMVPNVLTELHARAAKVVVSNSTNTVTVLDDMGKIIASYPCTAGSQHDPLPIGDWKINGVAHNPRFHYNPDLFWDANPKDSKAVIPPGPRNPVGVVWIDLSKEHYGIHGTPQPSLIGHSQSHGCIRLTNWDAQELAGLVKSGTPASLVN